MLVSEWVISCGIVAFLTVLLWFYVLRRMSSEREREISERAKSASDHSHSPTRRTKRVVKRPNSKSSHSTASSESNNQRRKIRRGRSDKDTVNEQVQSHNAITGSPQEVKMDTQTDDDRKSKRRKDGNDGGTTSRMDTSAGQRKSDFSHPVYKQMSRKNGAINRMSMLELQTTLQDLKLNSLGSGDVLKRRLKTHYMMLALEAAGLESAVPVHFDYFCVIDVEATCLENNPLDYIHEIIEFPIVLLNARTLQIEDTFEAFCKPAVNAKLSKFCSQLTNITQRMVDKADEFPVVLKRVEAWMESKGLGSKHTFAIVTDCSLDMDLYLKLQCLVSEIPYPEYAREWINVSKVFANVYKTKRMPLRTMLTNVGLSFLGQPHRGIDDAKNIARVTIQLLTDGADLKFNEKLTSM